MRTYTTIVASLIIHLLFYLGLLVWHNNHQTFEELLALHEGMSRRDNKVEIVLIENSPNAVEKPSEAQAFLAAKTQRVLEQRKARFTGQTQNREFPNRPSPSRAAQQAKRESVTDKNGEVSVDATERLNKALSSGISTLSESLPDTIKHGDFTALNTDQYLFYSFFSRIASRIRFQWESGVEQTIESLSFRNYNIREEKTFVTEVEVRLDKNGYYKGTSIYRSSGIEGLDRAVVAAFERSTPFINPPVELVKEDGLIHLYYAFHVYFSPQLFARPTASQ